MATRAEARDACMVVAVAACAAAGVTDVSYDAQGSGRRPASASASSPFAFVRLRHASSSAVTIGGSDGSRRFRRVCVLQISLWTRSGDGLTSADTSAEAVVASLEKANPGAGVDMTNVTANEIGEDGAWFGMLVSADVTYDQVQ